MMRGISVVFMVMVSSSVALNSYRASPCHVYRIQEIKITQGPNVLTQKKFLISSNGHEHDELKTSNYYADISCGDGTEGATYNVDSFYFNYPGMR